MASPGNALTPPHYGQRDENLFAQQQQQPTFSGAPSFDTIPTTYTQAFEPVHAIKRETPPVQPQFTDYPLYPEPDQKVHGLFENDFGGPATGSINPAELSLMGHHESHHSSHQGTPQLHHSPHIDQGTFLTTSGQVSSGYEWEAMMQPANAWAHRRAPSEYSEISSAAPSPYLGNQEFGDHPSPLLQAQLSHQGSMQDLLHGTGDSFGIENFSLQDRDISRSASPALSNGNSPFLMPQNEHMLGMIPQMPGLGGLGVHPPPPPPPPPQITLPSSRPDEGAPQINVIFAPPQRQPTFPKTEADPDALSAPPKLGRRQRAKSDPYAGGTIQSPRYLNPSSRSNSPSRSRRDSLSPTDIITAPVGSRSTSLDRTHQKGHSRRSSTNSVPNRDYILELAHPNRPGAPANPDTKRVQKHPANFQCHLCPKRFTRAYNLRSHLRTHTDERPFVCSVCGKAFARQHDRKRHEGLHSGEKKFVCRGNLKAGGTWGCGRRFARADALGRHFRSEAGRVCIRPLLDEETAELRARGQQPPHMLHSGPLLGHPGMQTMITDHSHTGLHPAMGDPNLGPGPHPGQIMHFPTALLEQYPALATMSWSSAPGQVDDEGEFEDGGGGGGFGRSGDESGRSSFDASAGEYDEDGGRDYDWHSDAGGGGAYSRT